jgi:hypothetical protein
MLHCIWTVPEIASNIQIDDLVAILKAGSNVLSATGEHWSEAKRSRDVLDGFSVPTIRWLLEHKARNTRVVDTTESSNVAANQSSTSLAHSSDFEGLNSILSFPQQTDLSFDGQYWDSALYGSMNGDISFTEEVDFKDPALQRSGHRECHYAGHVHDRFSSWLGVWSGFRDGHHLGFKKVCRSESHLYIDKRKLLNEIESTLALS